MLPARRACFFIKRKQANGCGGKARGSAESNGRTGVQFARLVVKHVSTCLGRCRGRYFDLSGWVCCVSNRASHQPLHHDLVQFICARALDTYACVSCLVVTPVATTYVRLHTTTATHQSGKVNRTTSVFTLAETPVARCQPPEPLHGGWPHGDDSMKQQRAEASQVTPKDELAGHASTPLPSTSMRRSV